MRACVRSPPLLLLFIRPVAEIEWRVIRLQWGHLFQPWRIMPSQLAGHLIDSCNARSIIRNERTAALCTGDTRHVTPAQMSAAPSASSNRSVRQSTGNTAYPQRAHRSTRKCATVFWERCFVAMGLEYESTKRFFGKVFRGARAPHRVRFLVGMPLRSSENDRRPSGSTPRSPNLAPWG